MITKFNIYENFSNDISYHINMIYYHASPKKFDSFEITNDIGFHFGTKTQALDKMKQDKIRDFYLYKVKINVKNTLRTIDKKTWFGTNLLDILSVNKLVNRKTMLEELENLKKEYKYDSGFNIISDWSSRALKEWNDKLKQILYSTNYDSIIYKNKYEDKKSGDDSIIVFDKNNIEILDVIEYKNWRILENVENKEQNMINNIFNRCDKNLYMDWISNADIDLFTVDDKFDEYEARVSFLEEQYGIRIIEVEEQYLVSFEEYLPEIKRVIGDYPILLYHYTSSNLLKTILEKGLIKGYKRTNPFTNTYSGVYLTTETTGNAVKGYVRMAIQKHRGEGVQLYIKTYFKNIEQDPDDADLRSGRYQFITDYVPPENIIFHENYFA